MRYVWCVAVLCTMVADSASAIETDQYLVWGRELDDSHAAINRYINDEITGFLNELADSPDTDYSCSDLTRKIFLHFHRSRRDAPIVSFLQDSPRVDQYPPPEVANEVYRRMSIYRGRTFPFFLPMARTVRVGDIYAGTDKIGHMFGYGRRYYKRFLRARARGVPEAEAIDRVMRWGVLQERSIIGTWIDGVFSYADLEANFQGFELARDFCEGEQRYLARVGGQWTLVRPVDLRIYMTPEFDESYNPSRYRGFRKRFVQNVIDERYASREDWALRDARFAVYTAFAPSSAQAAVKRIMARRTVEASVDDLVRPEDAGYPPVALVR